MKRTLEMKPVTWVLLALMGGGCSHPSVSPLPDFERQPSARELSHCPFGHEQLKEIPIVYGMLLITPELQKQIDNLEVWPGGCILGPWDKQIVCLQCRYAYEPSEKAWAKSSADPTAFGSVLSPIVSQFVVSPDAKAIYSHTVQCEHVLKQNLSYWTAEPVASIEARVITHLNAHRIDPSRNERSFWTRQYVELHRLCDEGAVDVELMFDDSVRKTHVSLQVKLNKPED